MPHADQLQYIGRVHDGEQPRSWSTGDLDFQMAKVIAALAHHMTKDPADPELPACDLTFQESCTCIVESIMRGAPPSPTDTLFAQKAHELYLETLAARMSDKEDHHGQHQEIRS